MLNKTLSILLGMLLLIVGSAAYAALPPRISWTPAQLTPASMSPGTSTSHTVVLKHTGILPIPFTNQLRIVAEGAIAPFVTITQPKFPALLKRGNQVTFQVTVSVPANTPAGEINGNLVLKRILPNGKVKEVWRAEALPILIHVSQGISWNTPSLEVEVLNGTVVVKSVSFKVSQTIANPTFQIETINGVSPIDLANLIKIQSSKSTDITESDEVQLGVVFNVSTDIPEGKYLGVLHVLDGTKTVEQTLQISLSVIHGSSSVVPDGVSTPSPDRIVGDTQNGQFFTIDQAEIVLRDGTDFGAFSSRLLSLGGVFMGQVPHLPFYQIRFPSIGSPEELDTFIELLQGDPDVLVATREWRTESRAIIEPNDSEYGENGDIWDEDNPSGRNAPWEFTKFPSAWYDVYAGKDTSKLNKINIAVVDHGFSNHPDLDIRLSDLFNVSDFFTTIFKVDFSHGTSVAGVIGAIANNTGVVGGIWNTNLRLYNDGSIFGEMDVMEQAIEDGAQILNYSQGSPYKNQKQFNQDNLKWRGFFDKGNQCDPQAYYCTKNTLFVFAAPNLPDGGNDPFLIDVKYDLPASLAPDYENIISVTGVSQNQEPTFDPEPVILNHVAQPGLFVSAGAGGNVTVAAPFRHWLAKTLADHLRLLPIHTYRVDDGTSFATPMVSALAGLILTKNPNLTPKQIKDIIVGGACAGGKKVTNILNSVPGVSGLPPIDIIDAYESVKLADNPDALVCQPLSSIQFIDSNLTECINNQNWQHIEQATNLTCAGKAITDLSGIENLKFLRTLDLSGNTINNLSHLSGLTQLEQLNLYGNIGLSCVELDELAVKLSSTTITRPAECVPSTTWSIAPASVSVSESAGTVSFTISRTNSAAAQTVYVSTVQDQGSTNNGDYVGKLNEPVPFAAVQTKQPVTVTINNNDNVVEGNETFRLIVQESTTDPINTSTPSATFTILDSVVIPGPTGKLNDTGITDCSDATTNGLVCPVAGFPGQDGEHGRDAQALTGTLQKVGGGQGGFDFTKLDSNGNPMPASAIAWDCVKDNVTGLVWEVKTDDGGLRDKDNTYSWYEPDSSRNGGDAGTQNVGICTGSNCDTQSYVQAVNVQGLCGASDWRMPDVNELLSIVNNATVNPAIDTNYFPNTSASAIWSSSPLHASNLPTNIMKHAWHVSFDTGYVHYNTTSDNSTHVRLVRGGQ